MPNTLTNLIPSLYASLDVVSRELVGLIPAVSRDPRTDRVAQNQTVYVPVAPASAASDVTPAVTPPDDGNQTIGSVAVTITKFRRVPIRWQGEESLALNNNGPGQSSIFADQVQQALRTLTNEMEADLAAQYLNSSRAYGTAGTTPFASDIIGIAQARKILDDNGAPPTDRHMIIDTTAAANLRSLGNLIKANEAGTDATLRGGVLLNINNFSIRESGQIKTPAVGTSSSATTNTAGYAIGATVITLASAGTGSLLPGDSITFTGDTNKYILAAGDADNSNGGTITLQAPGLRKALATSAVAITVVAAATRNMFFSRNAFLLASRLIALPPGGDMASDRTSITDPISGISFEVAVYPQYRQTQIEISAAWGTAGIKPEHAGNLLG